MASRTNSVARPTRSLRLPSLLLGVSLIAAACGADADTLVISQRSDEIPDVVAGAPQDPTDPENPTDPEDPADPQDTTTSTPSRTW